jgi:hypothetical protein
MEGTNKIGKDLQRLITLFDDNRNNMDKHFSTHSEDSAYLEGYSDALDVAITIFEESYLNSFVTDQNYYEPYQQSKRFYKAKQEYERLMKEYLKEK